MLLLIFRIIIKEVKGRGSMFIKIRYLGIKLN